MAHSEVVFNTGKYCPIAPSSKHQCDRMSGSHPYLNRLLMLIR